MPKQTDEQLMAQLMNTSTPVDDAQTHVNVARAIARQEVASAMGLFLRRLQDTGLGREAAVTVSDLSSIVGELLQDFGGTLDEPGPAHYVNADSGVTTWRDPGAEDEGQ